MTTVTTTPPPAATLTAPNVDPELRRLAEADSHVAPWRRWGPYLSERQWGTVREDYSPHGDCWNFFPHDHARSRAYRWGEDGLMGICDDECSLCFSLALWNGKDPILKERLFGLTGPEGNHGEDVKEHYFYLDSTPTHSYMKALYKYPQTEFPYRSLAETNRRRSRDEREFEIEDTGVFDASLYFDVEMEYAKASAEDVLARVTVRNRGPREAACHVLPTLWFRNTWSWGEPNVTRPTITKSGDSAAIAAGARGSFEWNAAPASDGTRPELVFTENDSNQSRLWNAPNPTPFVKDAFHSLVVEGHITAVNPAGTGTKAAAWYKLMVPAGGSVTLDLRLTRCDGPSAPPAATPFGAGFAKVLADRTREADAFFAGGPRSYNKLFPQEQLVARQAAAGLLWSKQFYEIDVARWLDGDPNCKPPAERLHGRNAEWRHLNNRDVISMPDKWEYPWYAAWDLAFQTLPFAKLDPHFAKHQLVLLLREWYMHPSGQIPAYEFAFGDVNPPVHAWAAWRVYKMTGERGKRDRVFLARCFQKLLLNFTWWVNRKDPSGKNLFSGGFLGLDNIGVFDRSKPLPTGGHLEQADGTAWMAFYCGTMLSMALELAGGEGGERDAAYEDMATKFFEHFIGISDAMNTLGGNGLWDETDGFYYDQIRTDHGATPLRVHSLVGMVPLLAVEVLESEVVDRLPDFKTRMEWFLKHKAEVPWRQTCADSGDHGAHHKHMLLAIPNRERLERVVTRLMDETEFLSPFGVRSLSKFHKDNPYIFHAQGEDFRVDYTPGESTTGLFGGNSNWRGPIWFPLNFLLIEALERYHHFYGDSLTVEFPRGSGKRINLKQASMEIRNRLLSLFLPGSSPTASRPCHGDDTRFATDPAWKDLVYFYEHFHGDTGRGLGATHQTGWTALVLNMLGRHDAGH
ncbi:MAG: glucosidase [Phycisphaerales bacterium]|jgi:hypothetical protein